MKTIQITEFEEVFLRLIRERINQLPLDELGGIFLTIDGGCKGNLHSIYLTEHCVQALQSVVDKLNSQT